MDHDVNTVVIIEKRYMRDMKCFFPWKSIFEVFVISMIICILASIGPIKKLLSQSIIDSIRTVE